MEERICISISNQNVLKVYKGIRNLFFYFYYNEGNQLRKVKSEDDLKNKPGTKMALYLKICIKHSQSTKGKVRPQCQGKCSLYYWCQSHKWDLPELVLLVFLTCLKMLRDCHSWISTFSLGLDVNNTFNFVVSIHLLLTQLLMHAASPM